MSALAIREGHGERWGVAVGGLFAYIWIEAHHDLHFWRYPLICGIGAAVVLVATLFPNHDIVMDGRPEGVDFTLERSCCGFWKTRERRTLAAGAQVILAFERDDDGDISGGVQFADGSFWRAPAALWPKRAQVRAFLQAHGLGVVVRER